MNESQIHSGVPLIAAERTRQITAEGWLSAHDDTHIHGELAKAAALYTIWAAFGAGADPATYKTAPCPEEWPWFAEDWKPKSPIEDLVRAGALIAAEIDRLQRSQTPTE